MEVVIPKPFEDGTFVVGSILIGDCVPAGLGSDLSGDKLTLVVFLSFESVVDWTIVGIGLVLFGDVGPLVGLRFGSGWTTSGSWGGWTSIAGGFVTLS